jgi:hypothetical protein
MRNSFLSDRRGQLTAPSAALTPAMIAPADRDGHERAEGAGAGMAGQVDSYRN